MKLWRKSANLILLLLQAALLLQLGCAGTTGGGGNLAAPPAPIAELPSVLQIPKDLSINVNKTRSGAGPAAIAFLSDPYLEEALAKFLTAGVCGDGALNTGEQCDDANLISGDGCSATCQIENFSEQVAFSANLVFFANTRLAALLGPLSTILIPVDPNLHRLESIIFVGTKSYIARLDFGDFDLNGTGGTEGCSGNTAGLPICVRVWLDDGTTEIRLLAARFDQYPLPENPGAGSLRGEDLTFGPVGSIFRIAANYDHFDPLDKFTDSFFGGLIEAPPAPTEVFLPLRAFASQKGEDFSALKTSNGSQIDTTIGSFAQGFGRWLENDNFWIGSFQSNDPPLTFTDQCVKISTGEEVSTTTFCQPLGLTTAGLGFLGFTTVDDLEFFDFPPLAP